MPDSAYFTLADNVGLDPDGNPEPLVAIGLTIVVPSMVNGKLVEDTPQRVELKPIAGTRVVKVDDPIVATGLRNIDSVVECDPPTQQDLTKSREAVTDAREHAGTHTDTEE